MGNGDARGGADAGVNCWFLEADPVLQGRCCTGGKGGIKIMVEEMILMFGEDGGSLVVKVPNADDGAIAEIIVVFFLGAVD
jgi:hypothetical protein